MSVSNIYISSQTRLFVPQDSTSVVLLSSSANPFTFTVHDINGYASSSNPIRISTTHGVFFNTIENLSSYTLTQPYSFLTIRNLSSTRYFAVNSFGLTSTQSVFQISSLTTSTIQASTMSFLQPNLSTVTVNRILTSSALIQGDVIVGASLFISSSATFASTTVCSSLSTLNIQVGGETSTIGNLAIGHRLIAGGGLLIQDVTIPTTASFGSVSTTSNLIVQRQGQLANAVLNNGSLSTLDGLSFTNIIAGSLIVQREARFNSNANINLLSTPSLFIQSNCSIGMGLNVNQQLTTSSLLTQGVTNMQDVLVTNLISTVDFQGLDSLSTPAVFTSSISSCSSFLVGTNLLLSTTTASSITSYQTSISTAYISSLTNDAVFSNPNQINIIGLINASTFLRNTSTVSYKSDEMSILNLCNVTIQETTSVRSQAFGFNDTTYLNTAFTGKTANLFWNFNGYFLAASYSGEIMAAVGDNSNIYLTSNFGSNFSAVQNTLTFITDFQISGNGQFLAACHGSSNLMYSQNYGATWYTKTIRQVTGIPSNRLSGATRCIGFSYNGQYQLVNGYTTGTGTNQNNIIASSDFGASWIIVYKYGSSNLLTATTSAISSNGQYQALAGSFGANIYMNSNYGTIGFWSNVGPGANWASIAMSYSGQYITATANNSFIFTSSNYGGTWVPRATTRNWWKNAMTADGRYQVAAADQVSTFYYSSDYGVTWLPRTISTLQSVKGITISKNPGFSFLATQAFGPLLFGKSAMNFQSAVDISGDVAVASTISKTAGAFEIPHPTQSNTLLTHSFIEGPRADLLYRGKATFSNASTLTIDIEQSCTSNNSRLTKGTFTALARNPQVFLKNNCSPVRVKGVLHNSLLHITTSAPCSDTIDWMVVAERADAGIRSWRRVDKQGYLVLEHPV